MPAFGRDLPKELAFYSSYHTHPANQVIHLLCIPALFWSWSVALCSVASLPLPEALRSFVPGPLAGVPIITPGLALWAMYAIYYTVLDPFAGSIIGFIYLLIYLAAAWFTAQGTGALGLSVLGFAAAVQVAGWAVQLGPGHAFFERRKPALLDSLAQAFLLAPLFIWLEVFFVFGYRPKLKRDVEKLVEKQLAAWGVKEAKGRGRSGGAAKAVNAAAGGEGAAGGGEGSAATPRRSTRTRIARAE